MQDGSLVQVGQRLQLNPHAAATQSIVPRRLQECPGSHAITLRAGLAIRTSPGDPDRKALQGTPAEIVEDLRGFKALGVSHVLMEASYRDLGQMTRTFEAFARDIRPQV